MKSEDAEYNENTALIAKAQGYVAKGLQLLQQKKPEPDGAYKEFSAAISIYKNEVRTRNVHVDNLRGQAHYYRAYSGLTGNTEPSLIHRDLNKACKLYPIPEVPYVQLYYALLQKYIKISGLRIGFLIEKSECCKSIFTLPSNNYTFEAIRSMLMTCEKICAIYSAKNYESHVKEGVSYAIKTSKEALNKLRESEQKWDKKVIYDIYSMTMKITQYFPAKYKDSANLSILMYTARILKTGHLSIDDLSIGFDHNALFLRKLGDFLKKGPGYDLLFDVIKKLSAAEAIHLLKLVLVPMPVPAANGSKFPALEKVKNLVLKKDHHSYHLFPTLDGEFCDEATYGQRIQNIKDKLAELEAEQLRQKPATQSQVTKLLDLFSLDNLTFFSLDNKRRLIKEEHFEKTLAFLNNSSRPSRS